VRDSSDFDGFYVASRNRILAQLTALIGDQGEAQDCLQEAYARAWQRWSKVGRYDDPAAWVRTVAVRLANNRWRRSRNSALAWIRHGPPTEQPAPTDDAMLLVAALRRLPESQRRALVLYYLGDMAIEQVAQETNAPVGTVKARLARGRTALAAALTESGHVKVNP
jgi:RNA polymerase sigma-70 factor (ECF subfamily)